MKYLAIIQARCGSTRLPNKVLMDLCGKPALQRMIERVQRSKCINELAVVTSIEKNNLPILKLCSELGIRVGVGSENDVLDRFYQFAKLLKPEYVIRLTADCPLFDWCYLDMALEKVDNDVTIDYCGQLTDTFPDGLDIEVIKFSALKKSWSEARLQSEREHVTQYIKKRPDKFNIVDLICPIANIGGERWTLDERDDYKLIKKIYDNFFTKGQVEFTTENIIDYLKANPDIANINKHIGRNEGLGKSLQNDFEVIIS